jgi:hypothetical protein
MIIVCLANFIQFLMRPRIYMDVKKVTLNELKEKEIHAIFDVKEDVDKTESSEQIKSHYVWMEKRFN